MKINWKVRFRNKTWLTLFLSLILGFVYNILSLFDVYPPVTENQIAAIGSQVLTFLGLVGVLVDPTTDGLGDSNRAMDYEYPHKDNEQEEQEEGK